MPTPHEHLVTAEALLAQARQAAEQADYHAADAYSQLAAAHAVTVLARRRVEHAPPAPAPAAAPASQSQQRNMTAAESLPPWCGNCDGPTLAMRWTSLSRPGRATGEMVRCPECNPYAPERADGAAPDPVAAGAAPDHRAAGDDVPDPRDFLPNADTHHSQAVLAASGCGSGR